MLNDAYEIFFSQIFFIKAYVIRGGGHIDFGADPIGVNIDIRLSFLHNIL